MNHYEELVKDTHKSMECAINEPLSVDVLQLRINLLEEEMKELKTEADTLREELQQNHSTKPETRARFLKELADLQYVLSGMAVSFNLPLDEAFERVHTSNLSKLVNGKPLKREDGKFLKGPNYQPPYLDDLALRFK